MIDTGPAVIHYRLAYICEQCGAGKIVMRGADKEDMAAACRVYR